MITIENKGPEIVRTNYFDTHQGRNFYYLSWNAGAMRLLVPDSQLDVIADMRAARYVIATRGPWTAEGGRDSIELLFEDKTDSPFCVHMLTEQVDRLIVPTGGLPFKVLVYTREGEQLRLKGRYRRADALPCLAPWGA